MAHNVQCFKLETKKHFLSQDIGVDGEQAVAHCDYIKELKSMDCGTESSNSFPYSPALQHHWAKLLVQ